MFQEAGMLVLNKMDLLPYTDFSVQELEQDVQGLNHGLEIFYVSASKDRGVEDWTRRIVERVGTKRC
jgi:hydrogenase nickel incorporation protein HypB